ncbi:ribosome maturation factor RimM [Cytophagaceae bacterium DM2B3-1]|uniref:Ribosome maturation factor RimM n=1 Tax=Xanthocytophaga flava TaxID=3048013 RepID=A0ABT7CH56_9BACT|nr:ribosome maturation factor RimM [Xanthocytophaga flavus]MDJ1492846.1 ribosome maturation factor RimM [Xanthocytophaga flavus]
MQIRDCFELGYVAKTHGLKGELVIMLDVDDPDEYEEMDSFFIQIKGQLVPYFMESYNLQGNRAIVKLEDVNTIDAAKSLIGNKLFLPLDNLPDLEDDQFYYHQVMGYTIVDETKGDLGQVDAIYDMPGHDLLAMKYQGKEVLIPVNDEIVKKADHEQKIVYVSLPEGLLEVFLNEGDEKGDDEEE